MDTNTYELTGNKFAPDVHKILVTGLFVGASVKVNHVACCDPKAADAAKNSPTGTLPYLATNNGNVSTVNAISLFLASTLNPAFIGNQGLERIQVAQWVEFTSSNVDHQLHHIVWPLFGWSENHSHEVEQHALSELKNDLKVLNNQLNGRKFLVGDNLTYADVNLFFSLRHYYQLSVVDALRNNAYPNLTRWFNDLANHPNVVKVAGRTILGNHPQKPVKLPKEEKKPVVQPKKPDVKESTGGDEDDDEKPVAKKAKSALDLLPPTTLDLETWKREFMNSKDRKATMNEFWPKFDPQGWSFHWVQYQNLPSEGKVLFKTKNNALGFLQKFEHFRKYAFGVYGVYGVEENYVCRGIFMWRGQGTPQEVQDHDSWEYMDHKELNWETDRNFIEEYFLNLNEGVTVDGREVAFVETFK